MKPVFQKISDNWFLSEPLMFSVLCKHNLVENNKMAVRFRSGKMRIEYNSDRISKCSIDEIEEYLKIEIIRILLKHPYQRKPYMGRKDAIAVASDLTIAENHTTSVYMHQTSMFNLPPNGHFEEYYFILAEIFKNYQSPPNEQPPCNDALLINDGGGKELSNEDGERSNNDNQNTKDQNNNKQLSDQLSDAKSSNQPENDSDLRKSKKQENEQELDVNLKEESEKSELWEDDALANDTINDLIDIAEKSKHWGSITGKIIESIKASQLIQINYRQILNHFKASILSNQRKLTRFKPSRRYGFLFMGAKYDFCTNLLVAIDVSGSVTSQKISNFLAVINRFFNYGIKSIDIVQFDTIIKGELCTLKNAAAEINIAGRGGTDFQCVFDYVENKKYDGLIIFTDGYASVPTVKKTKNIKYLWMLVDKESYMDNKDWMLKLPKTQATWLPFYKN